MFEKLIIISILYLATGCQMINISDEEVISDIFPQLIDSIVIEWRPLPPPPPPPLLDKDSNFAGIDSLKFKSNILEHERIINLINSKDNKTIVVINDSCFPFDKVDLLSKIKSDDSLTYDYLSKYNTKSIYHESLGVSQIEDSYKYKFISASDFEDNHQNIWNYFRNRKFARILEFSEIHISSDKEFGLLQIDYYYDLFDAFSYYALIKKTENGWKLEKIYLNWVT